MADIVRPRKLRKRRASTEIDAASPTVAEQPNVSKLHTPAMIQTPPAEDMLPIWEGIHILRVHTLPSRLALTQYNRKSSSIAASSRLCRLYRTPAIKPRLHGGSDC